MKSSDLAILSPAQRQAVQAQIRARPSISVGHATGATTAPVKRKRRGEGEVAQFKRASALENRFRERWTLLKGPALESEYVAVPGRKWRFDFACVPARILYELHGGIWTQGRHTRGSGFVKDRSKMLAAQRAGWLVVELSSGELTAANIEKLIAEAKERMAVQDWKER